MKKAGDPEIMGTFIQPGNQNPHTAAINSLHQISVIDTKHHTGNDNRRAHRQPSAPAKMPAQPVIKHSPKDNLFRQRRYHRIQKQSHTKHHAVLILRRSLVAGRILYQSGQ